ncbi:MAG: HPr family phosphocarrier protein [Actinomycetota bacterium]|nr:HPr family phosphocarrier protein [Actinomycetota bacterium]
MKNFSIKVKNSEGLHARPASRLVELCHRYSSDIYLSFNGIRANAKNITEVLSLGVENGEVIGVSISGEDEQEVNQQLHYFFKNKFSNLRNY